MKNLGTQTGTSEVNLTNRIWEVEERISGTKDTRKKYILWSKKMLNIKKNPDTKYPGNLRHYEKTKE